MRRRHGGPRHPRTVIVTGLIVVAVIALGGVALSFGEYPIAPAQVFAALTGVDSASVSDGVRGIVVDWRLPRVLVAILGGAALGLSGAVFQSITRNPLGSPDIIGFNAGAYTGALIVMVLLGASGSAVTVGALVGGLAAGFAVYLLAFQRGVQGYRLIVVGIAVSAVLSSLNAWMIVTADLPVAIGAASWGAGDLGLTDATDVWSIAIVLLVAVPIVLVCIRPLRALECGDDTARSIGVRPEAVRVTVLVVGVALVAVVTAAVGPIAFIALAAPQLARRLVGSASVVLLPSAAMGAGLLLAGDVLAQRLFAPLSLPVGVVTAVLGGAYLVSLLIGQARRSRWASA